MAALACAEPPVAAKPEPPPSPPRPADNSTLGERFRIIKKIGEGTFGQVYKAEELRSKSSRNWPTLAMKRVRMEAHDEGVPVTTLREVSLLKELEHENVIPMFDIFYEAPKLWLVFEFLDFDLKACLDQSFKDGTPLLFVKSAMLQIMRGLVYTHAKRVIHRDLKPQNVLVNMAGRVKIGDYGLSRAFQTKPPQYTQKVCTLWYRVRPARVELAIS